MLPKLKNQMAVLQERRNATADPDEKAALDLAITTLQSLWSSREHTQAVSDNAQVGVSVSGDVTGNVQSGGARYEAALQIFVQAANEERLAHASRTYSNLPPPTYSQFVMRRQAFNEVVDALQTRAAIVLICGLGGMGKTSLAHEIADRSLKDDGTVPRYNTVVWVSDKDQFGATTLQTVLDEVALVMDRTGVLQLEFAQKRREVENLLRKDPVLLVIDSFETVTDDGLIDWLNRYLPEPSKALVTTRERRREFQNSWSVELRGMTDDEAQAFLTHHLYRLRLIETYTDLAQFTPLLKVTGGNPKAIETALGYLKYEHVPLPEIVDQLYESHELFDYLFERSWQLLNDDTRHVLMAATLFPASTRAEALRSAAQVTKWSITQAIGQLIDLSLLEERPSGTDRQPRYGLHPLVRAFASKRLDEQPAWVDAAHERWLAWTIDFVADVGWPWSDLRRLERLDDTDDEAIVFAAIQWVALNDRHSEMIRLAYGVDNYYYVRGFWDKKIDVDRKRIAAAQALGDIIEEARSLAQYVQVLCTRGTKGDITEAANWITRLDELRHHPQLVPHNQETANVMVQIFHALAFYAMAPKDNDEKDYDEAYALLEASRKIIPAPSENLAVATLRWIGECRYRQNRLEEARAVFTYALQIAEANNDERALINCRLGLARILLDQGDFDTAQVLLDEAHGKADIHKERRYTAQIQLERARLYVAHDNLHAALEVFAEAEDLFQRLHLYPHRERLEDTRGRLALLLQEQGSVMGQSEQ